MLVLSPLFSNHKQLWSYSHEVRNPLTSAMAALSFVTEHTEDLVENPRTRKLILDDGKNHNAGSYLGPTFCVSNEVCN